MTANPYQKLDQSTSAPALLHASAGRVAVGLEDPKLGWLEVTTRSAPEGQVAAAILTGSSHTQAAMAAQLPSLSHYLAEQSVKVSHLDVAQKADSQGAAGSQAETQSGTEGGSQQGQSQQGNTASTGSGQDPIQAALPGSTLDAQGGWLSIASEDTDATPLRYISVRA
ncbi:hypothetical protein [Silvibacterium sp.]|uniref:hypothetical protein n=1 Tax=Silvibacterium sp. TaxID=1964179 RepID=UPI0039E4F429